MVTRKPLPESAALDPAIPQQTGNAWPQSNHPEDESIWGDGAQNQQGQQSSTAPAPADVPNSLRPGATTQFTDFGEEGNIWAEGVPALSSMGGMGRVPSVLTPGRSHVKEAITSHSTGDSQGVAPVPAVLQPGGGPKPETNPFKRKMSLSAGSSPGKQTVSHNIPPVPEVSVADFSQLSVNETSTNPWQPALDGVKAPPNTPPKLPDQESVGDNVWASAKPSRQPTPGPALDSPALMSLPSEEGSAGWEEESRTPNNAPPLISTANDEVLEDAHTWDDLKTLDKGKGPAQPPPVPSKGATGIDDWNLIDLDTRPDPPSRQSSWENFKDEDAALKKTLTEDAPAVKPPAVGASAEGVPAAEATEQAPPQLPPRTSAELPPPQPPRPVRKSETYQIKKINWHDATAANNPRMSPILVQNANGPCPLVALVNALTLTTPAERTNTALVETLRSREQVSLGFLLDAVFDELMSERQARSDAPLPDMTDLYNFLKGLHTGMNVNPRFIPTPEVVTAFKRTSLTHLHPTERTDMIPGTFEHTREMALYSTFAIPLIHGWLPSKDNAVYQAFERQATSYEDAQNLLFREEELEAKLCDQHQGLSPEEQQIYQDVLTIKSFLSISATQLTNFGLDVIKKAMKPGSVAILFRNDHFSTLYRHPQTLELLTLVTDAGYAGHPEVVWESLVDVNGERAEFFSGDFRVVGGATHDQQGSFQETVPENWTDAMTDGDNGEWTTVPARRGRTQTARQSAAAEPPVSPKHEQEDRDLALALQLQEEEDERARNEQERRRRESRLSEQYIEQQGRTTATRGGRGGGSTRGGSRSTTSLTSTNSSATTSTGRRVTPAQPGAIRPASASTTSLSTNGNITRPPRPTTQTVRSLLPPRGTPTTTTTSHNVTNRPAEDGLDDAPPSYEQAAKQLPYVPPAGHPSHPGASPSQAASTSGLQGQGQGRGMGSPRAGMNGSVGRGGGRGGGGYPGGGYGYGGRGNGGGQTGLRRGVPPAGAPAGVNGNGNGAGARERERERECVVM